jgi:hypothetical protein
MSVTFEQQPSGSMGALSPIIYQVYDTDYTKTGFYYLFDVYVWNGAASFPASPNYSITKYPDQYANNRAWIDIHKLVNQALTEDFLDVGTYKPNVTGGACYFGVKAKGVWATGSGSYVSSNIKLATNGWSYTFDGFNHSYGTQRVFTDKTTFYITAQTPSYYVWYDANLITSITIGSTSVTPVAVTSSSNYIQGIDVVQLLAAAGVSSDTTITFAYSGGTQVYNIDYQCQNKYGSVTIHYLNNYGVYDTMVFNALSKKVFNYERETYQKPIFLTQNMANAWTYGVHQTQNFLTNATTTMVVNTDYIPEAYNDIIQQLFASDNLLIDENNISYSARIVDSTFNRLTRINDKLIQYTLTIEYNQPLINKIVR